MQRSLTWQPGPTAPQIPPEALHPWLAHLEVPRSTFASLHQTLSPDELARARKFRFADDAARFVVARGALRTILASYTGMPPEELRFEYSSLGKPRLASEHGEPIISLSFNLSHSGELALYAVGFRRRIGVDIEQVRPQTAEARIPEHFFSSREVEALRQLPPTEQVSAFFRGWTRKEAYVKARGKGLSFPFNRFDVTLRPDEPPALLSTDRRDEDAARWSLLAVDFAPGYEAAVAVEGSLATVQKWLFRLQGS